MRLPYIIGGFLALALTTLAAGLAATRLFKLKLSRGESLCLGYALGCPIVSTLALALAAVHLARKGVFVMVTAVALLGLCWIRNWFRELEPLSVTAIPLFFRLLFILALGIYGVLYFRQALSPEMSSDAMTYHLGLPNLWNHAHGLVRSQNMYAALPEGMEMLYLFAFTIGRHSAAALFHFSLLMLLPVLMVLYGFRFKLGRVGPVVAALFVFASPLVGADGSVAYNDVALAVFILTTVYFLELWRLRKESGSLLACCLMAGFCFATKYTAVLVVAFVVTVVLWELRRTSRELLSTNMLLACALLASTISPYIVRNVIWFHNPIAFFGNSVFRNPYFHVSFEQNYIPGQVHVNGVTWKDVPMELTLGGPHLRAHFGPVFFLAPVAIAGVVYPEAKLLTAATAVIGSSYLANKAARFVIPFLPLLCLVMTFVLGRIPFSSALLGVLVVVHLLLSWPNIDDVVAKGFGPHVGMARWEVALRRVPEEQYLAERMDEYRMARLVEGLVPQNESVFSFNGGLPQAYTTRNIVVSFQSALGEKIADLFASTWWSLKEGRRRFVYQMPVALVRDLEIRQLASTKTDNMWSINEIQFWNGLAQVPCAPRWRMDAFPNPWDIGMVLDGNEASRWRSWEPLRRGMWIRVRLDPERAMDRIVIFGNDGQWESDMAVRTLTHDGQWLILPPPRFSFDPPLSLRRAATDAAKKMGVRYFLFSKSDPNAGELYDKPESWGLRRIALTRNWMLLVAE